MLAPTEKEERAHAFAKDQLKSFVERIERVESEVREMNDDKSDIYKEAKSQGFDVKALKTVIARRRKDANEVAEQNAIVDLYLTSLGTLPATRARPRGDA